jgi:hypothetical protein
MPNPRLSGRFYVKFAQHFATKTGLNVTELFQFWLSLSSTWVAKGTLNESNEPHHFTGRSLRSAVHLTHFTEVLQMSFSIFTASTLAARRFEPSTVDEANAAAVLRVIRWFAVAAAVALALTIAAAWLAMQLGLAAYQATEGAPQGYEQYLEPIGPQPAFELSLEELAEASESLPIEWPAAMAAPQVEVQELAELPVKQLRRLAQERGLSIRDGIRVLRKGELVAAMA